MILVFWCSGAVGTAFEEECPEEAVEPPLDVRRDLGTRKLWTRVIHFESFRNVLASVGLFLGCN